MKKLFYILILIYLPTSILAQNIHHNLRVKISILDHYIEVYDEISFPREYLDSHHDLSFSLNENLSVEITKGKGSIKEIASSKDVEARVQQKKYQLKIPGREKLGVINIKYTGKIYDQIEEGSAEYARGFSETSGIIFEDGIYLAGATHWIPDFNGSELVTFNMETTTDKEWLFVSQGKRTLNAEENGQRTTRYESPEPMDEIYLIGGKWTEYNTQSDHVLFQAFLRTPDEKLANKYLGATQGYLSMYEEMIGPYPFTKFALVENFWETGYGMPSFTLLGPKVIRFPWILYSSYPHELLHNYWGNSVYVNYSGGNWCEGITAYMADHLLKEQQGQGAEYRQNTLQKYSDYVNAENDFPLSDFISRNNSAEEAIGYGKCLMINNMLRVSYGDKVFLNAYSKFFQDFKFKKASFDDIRSCFEEVTGENLKPFFQQWVDRKGAPSILLSNVQVVERESRYILSFYLNQVQDEEVFRVDIPVVIYFENSEAIEAKSVNLQGESQRYQFTFEKKPVRIEVDPEFQIFRRLDRREVPTSLTQLFGSKEAIIILPSESPFLEGYTSLANTWKATQEVQGKKLELILDNTLQELPKDKSIWIFGYENRFSGKAKIPTDYFDALDSDAQSQAKNLLGEGSMVYAIQNPENTFFTLGFLGSKQMEALAGLGRKLPHYGKYSYLGFEGNEPENKLKGIFPALGSPLNYAIPYNGQTFPVSTKLKPRKALAE